MLAFGIGYVIMQWIWPNPSERLKRGDLPIAEHLDEYRDMGSFELLEALANSPEFNADRDYADTRESRNAMTIGARRSPGAFILQSVQLPRRRPRGRGSGHVRELEPAPLHAARAAAGTLGKAQGI